MYHVPSKGRIQWRCLIGELGQARQETWNSHITGKLQQVHQATATVLPEIEVKRPF